MIKLPDEQCWFDRFLATTCCILATYAAGMSMFSLGIALFFTGALIASALVGSMMAKVAKPTRLYNWDGWLMGVAVVLVVTQTWPLNSILPDGGYPWNLIVVSTLSWSLVFAGLFAWRDGSLMFLTLPCIAIFGLVGVFDTWSLAVPAFFVFLTLGSILYARIHQRYMIERAHVSGFLDTRLLRRGAWKWMAGPEWAMAAAGAIVVISLMGAPLLQLSLENVSPNVNLRLPQRENQQNRQQTNDSDLPIGRGPNPLSSTPVFKVLMDNPTYLRKQAFTTYEGRGWTREQLELTDQGRQEANMVSSIRRPGPAGGTLAFPANNVTPAEPIENPRFQQVEIEIESGLHPNVYLPGPVVEVFGRVTRYQITVDGLVRLRAQLRPGDEVRAVAAVPPAGATSDNAELPRALRPSSDLFLSTENIPQPVIELAERVTAGADNDWERAMAIKEEIESRVRYNINASAVPPDADPCEYFLFDSQEGYCDLFATSQALMARAVGLPSRVTTGYIVNDPDTDGSGYYTVRERDYHAWAEIYFEGLGWVPFDPTEGAPNVEGAGVGTTTARLPWYQQTWFVVTVNVLIGAAVVALLAFLIIQSRPSLRLNKRTIHFEIAKQLGSFHRAIEKRFDRPKRFSQTTQEFVSLAGSALGEMGEEAREIANRFDRLMFGTAEPERESVLALGKQVSEFRNRLKRNPKATV